MNETNTQAAQVQTLRLPVVSAQTQTPARVRSLPLAVLAAKEGEVMAAFVAIPIPIRFWARVVKQPGCWVWTGRKDKDGYGILTSKKPPYTLRGPRVSWQIHRGEIPMGLMVLHTCDNPECTNPDHLYLGNNTQNMKDMMDRGRGCAGDKCYLAKLTWKQVEEIRRDSTVACGEQTRMAKKYHVAQPTISQILLNHTWRLSPATNTSPTRQSGAKGAECLGSLIDRESSA